MEIEEKSIFDMQGLNEIKKRPDILANITWDITPAILMEPRFHGKPEVIQKLKEIAGFMFYIESQSNPPALMLLKTSKSDITNTIGKIDEIPAEMIQRAIADPVAPPSHGMYAITEEIEAWLKKELGI